ncbi:arsenate reductase (glutaredoxin) [Methylomonas sp. EFPC3]|uniref:arsenate reductase (glutaredoxin) n=1 Tax=Methylomonas sp. EFPC3 TaxID=3021710 RepID=UPI002417E679|nr:arsenate reductase (glutaredoxin) [Methylomonas sp. EFPC3]WFP49256.1 arsenate reductase (glutaredoxin) [Methylomonas sp. EFPC3]
MSVKIYHNPRCGKSRDTLKLLEANNIQPEIVEYLKTPPTAAELQEILHKLGLKPRELMRTKEPEYKENGLDDKSLSDAELIEAMVRIPKLIERPIVLKDGKAAVGRPPEAVLGIL